MRLLLIATLTVACICFAEAQDIPDVPDVPDVPDGSDTGETEDCEVQTDQSLEGADQDNVMDQFSDQCDMPREDFKECEFKPKSCNVKVSKGKGKEFVKKVNERKPTIRDGDKVVGCTGARRRRRRGSKSGSGSGSKGKSGSGSGGSKEKSGSGSGGSKGKSGSGSGGSKGKSGSGSGGSKGKSGSGSGSAEDCEDCAADEATTESAEQSAEECEDCAADAESSTGSSEKSDKSGSGSGGSGEGSGAAAESSTGSSEDDGAESSTGSNEEGEQQQCKVDTNLKEKSYSEEFQKELHQKTAEELEVSVEEITWEGMEYSSECGCQQVTMSMSESTMSVLQSMVSQSSFEVIVQSIVVKFLGLVITGSSSAAGAAAAVCFSGDSMLTTPTGNVMMKDLNVDDKIAVIRGHSAIHFEPVWWFIHRVTDEKADFVRIETERSNILELSDTHLIPVVPCDFSVSEEETDDLLGKHSIFAGKVKPGDCLLSVVPGQEQMSVDKVVAIDQVEKTGYYSPVTAAGNVVVGNVAASCYSQLEDHSMQHILFVFMRRIMYSLAGVTRFMNADGGIPKVLQLLQYAGSLVLSA